MLIRSNRINYVNLFLEFYACGKCEFKNIRLKISVEKVSMKMITWILVLKFQLN